MHVNCKIFAIAMNKLLCTVCQAYLSFKSDVRRSAWVGLGEDNN